LLMATELFKIKFQLHRPTEESQVLGRRGAVVHLYQEQGHFYHLTPLAISHKKAGKQANHTEFEPVIEESDRKNEWLVPIYLAEKRNEITKVHYLMPRSALSSRAYPLEPAFKLPHQLNGQWYYTDLQAM